MGGFEHSSELIHRMTYPTAERSPLKKYPRVALAPSAPTEEPIRDDRREDTLVFHGLIASGEKLRLRNPWATFGSVLFQLMFLSAFAIIPLLQVEPLPKREQPTQIYLMPPPPHVGAVAAKTRAPRLMLTRAPSRSSLPKPVVTPKEQPTPTATTTSETAAGTMGGSPDGSNAGVARGASIIPIPVKAPEPPPVKRIRVASGVAQANLIHDVPPQYPPEAGRDRIEGTVVLLAIIGTDGTVKEVQVESGPSVLVQAAIEAVKQWRYKPYRLNGVPVEIDSRITINFQMSRG